MTQQERLYYIILLQQRVRSSLLTVYVEPRVHKNWLNECAIQKLLSTQHTAWKNLKKLFHKFYKNSKILHDIFHFYTVKTKNFLRNWQNLKIVKKLLRNFSSKNRVFRKKLRTRFFIKVSYKKKTCTRFFYF